MPTLKQMGYEGIVSHKFPGNEILFLFGFYLCLISILRLSFFFSSMPVTISSIAYLFFLSPLLLLLSNYFLLIQSLCSSFLPFSTSHYYLHLSCNLSYSSLNLSFPNYFCNLFQVVKQKHFEE